MKTISCKEAVEFILKREEGKLSLRNRLRLWRHLATCSLCRIFSVQNAAINHQLKLRSPGPLSLTDEEKKAMIQSILEDQR